ncbi:hypothetical protein GCM10018771_40790 [Streptomyces cellulosae]|nr:hypothetical protein GCM10018771_40790 [Streptomyces cellulosae]
MSVAGGEIAAFASGSGVVRQAVAAAQTAAAARAALNGAVTVGLAMAVPLLR